MEEKKVYVSGTNVITSLGFTTDETIRNILNELIGIRTWNDPSLSLVPLPLSIIDTARLNVLFDHVLSTINPIQKEIRYTRMEKLFILSVFDAIKENYPGFLEKNTQLVLSTTKGNIDLLETGKKDLYEPDRIKLWKLAEIVKNFFGFLNRPVIVSNACISGVLALGIAARMIRSGQADNVVVTGGDIISEFVVSGFTSFQALSPEPCKPFDAARNGLSLGEGCATMVLTSEPPSSSAAITVTGFATSNDANHISGPSRTGEELALAMRNALSEASLEPSDIGFVSAHGTATVYNDEMESKALAIAGLANTPVNSLKGYWGHTLGGAGVIESVVAIRSMIDGMLFKSAGFSAIGVPENINLIADHTPAGVHDCLKTASGFGGCNAAIVFHNERESHE